MRCKICQNASHPVFVTAVLKKYQVTYFRCSHCQFMQTEDPYWLNESYQSAITDIDIGPVSRSLRSAELLEGLILSSFDKNSRFLDYGAGYGILVRLMRDRGFDCHWHDKYCNNLFAKHFETKEDQEYELLSAFEVFEHLVDPLAEIEKMLGFSRNIALSTLLVPARADRAEDWWYFAPQHGQHVSFYTIRAFKALSQMYKLNFVTDGFGTHLLTEKPVSERTLRFFAKDTFKSRFVRRLLRRSLLKKSLLMDDFAAISGYRI